VCGAVCSGFACLVANNSDSVGRRDLLSIFIRRCRHVSWSACSGRGNGRGGLEREDGRM